MALASTTVWEVRNGGADTNGGGYKSDAGTTDYSLQDAAQLAITDAVTNGTTTITSAGAGFTAAMVGNICYITGGTGSVAEAWYEIASYVSATEITVDRTTGLTAGTGVTLNVGGALATYGALGKVILAHGVSGMKGFIKYHATPYDVTSSTYNVSGGAIELTATSQDLHISGYDSTRTIGNTDANKPTVQLNGGTPASMYTASNTDDAKSQVLCNVIFDLNSSDVSGQYAVFMEANGYTEQICYRVEVDCSSSNAYGFTQGICIACKASNSTSYGFYKPICLACVADTCSTGFYYTVAATCSNCIATGSTTVGFDGGSCHNNCVAYGGVTGFLADASDGSSYINCVATNNSAWGFNANSTHMQLYNCATGDNTSGRETGAILDIGAVTLTAAGTYFENAGAGDFRPKAGATNGGPMIGAGIAVPSSSNNTVDIGAVQHADSDNSVTYLYIN